MATARIDMRIEDALKQKASKASALLGYASLTEYISKLIDKDASAVIDKYSSFTIEDDCFDRFIAACEKAEKPNEALVKAAEHAKALGIS
jgi:uncharacterized protein (DUF1778 family)